MTPYIKNLLPKLGVVGNLPLNFRYGLEKYFGFSLPDVHLDHVIAKINIYIAHFTSSTILHNHTSYSSGKTHITNSRALEAQGGY